MKKDNSIFFVPGIILVGAVMRIPFTTIPTVLSDVADGLGVSVNSLGILTSIPLIMFAFCSSLAPRLADKFGLEKLFTMVLVALFAGSIMRVFNLPSLYIGTMIIGISIAMMNVLFPSIILANQPFRIGLLTTVYTTAMGIASSVASSVAVPIVKMTSWKGLIVILSLLILIALVVWFPNTFHNHMTEKDEHTHSASLWKNKAAIALLIFGGLQSLLFYTGMTWLPTMASQSGVSSEAAGILASIYSLMSLPFSLTIPTLTTSLSSKNRKIMLAIVSICGIAGTGMLLFQTSSFTYWLIVNILIGIAVSALFPYMLVAFSMKSHTPSQTAQLSGMVQSGGYLLAAFGPTLFGYSFDLFGSWTVAALCLFICTIVMTAALFYTERFEKIL
ncbi:MULTISPECIES: MFS transporter [Streptococcus]|uniref:MFS transporter, CP family, cyanate transporter n=1 Tax=Streptococcus equinus TaxID=1335 RepID=A0A239R6L4_STREI|nr:MULTISPECIES: MFS transporter [Streptococcus]MDO4887024.1 MFS transporter [Streptococcus sp.]MEE0949303.1 MFS transporter [Streptococcus equinus]SCW38682.1 MFS transporter, CP family, cyanate transporter [Streptococcus equinus]SEK57521.1 MFS transporter, CP family, cyanate transporter [Streptococcus equinus]SNU06060.1 MFS transporter, CP family, cyanate transporter [Streptococcus equinus]